MGSHGLTERSLAFLNYPAQLMLKSTKVSGTTDAYILLYLIFLRIHIIVSLLDIVLNLTFYNSIVCHLSICLSFSVG